MSMMTSVLSFLLAGVTRVFLKDSRSDEIPVSTDPKPRLVKNEKVLASTLSFTETLHSKLTSLMLVSQRQIIINDDKWQLKLKLQISMNIYNNKSKKYH